MACQPDSSEQPEDVIRAYQAYIDQNLFDQAGMLSTPAEQRRLQELAIMIANDLEDAVFTTEFLSISCTIQGDTANCECQMRDQYESYTELFQLQRSGSEWLVDVPMESDVNYEKELQSALDSLLRQ